MLWRGCRRTEFREAWEARLVCSVGDVVGWGEDNLQGQNFVGVESEVWNCQRGEIFGFDAEFVAGWGDRDDAENAFG